MEIRKIYPIIILCAIIALCLTSCGVDPWITGSTTDIVTITKITKYGKQKDGISPLKSKVGPVKMSHKVHQDHKLNCIDCHHKKGNDERIKTCAVCHKGEEGYEVMHGLCLDCHMAKKIGVEKCKQCH
ncbi:MAG: cytochrome c family protein [Spirochaetes bacterium]|nr:cytochrome c family protein [Spirochaetota bacterium]